MTPEARLNLRQVAERLGVHYMTAYHYVRTGRLPAQRQGAIWTVSEADLVLVKNPLARARRPRLAPTERPQRLAERLVAGDEPGAWSIVEGAMSSGAEPADVHTDILVPALRSIGDGWASGDLSVADEHRASAVASRIIGRLGPRFARRGRTRGTVVLGAPPGELHSLPGAILADLLRLARFEVADLGADTPAVSFTDAARQADRLVAVLIGVTTPAHATAAGQVAVALRRADITAPILMGGRAIGGLDQALSLEADGWTGRDAKEAVAAVERLVERPAPSR